jgi:hypothetical protein
MANSIAVSFLSAVQEIVQRSGGGSLTVLRPSRPQSATGSAPIDVTRVAKQLPQQAQQFLGTVAGDGEIHAVAGTGSGWGKQDSRFILIPTLEIGYYFRAVAWKAGMNNERINSRKLLTNI